MTDRDRVLSRIRALLQKTVANGCLVEEAMAAHAKAQALIDKYQVSHEELYGTGPGPRSRKTEPEPEPEPEPAEPKQRQQPEPKKSVGIGVLFPFKTAITIGIVLFVAVLWSMQQQMPHAIGVPAADQTWKGAFVAAVRRCFKFPYNGQDADQFEADIDVHMRPDGTLASEPTIVAVRGSVASIRDALAEDAKQAIVQCQPYALLPKPQYAAWKYIPMTFGLKDLNLPPAPASGHRPL
jgi:colicin import membrane protein